MGNLEALAARWVGVVLDSSARQMFPGLRVRCVLKTPVARLLALALLVLVVSPFTAPFATFDRTEIALEHVLHPADLQGQATQDTADFAHLTHNVVPTVIRGGVDARLIPERFVIPTVHGRVLRI